MAHVVSADVDPRIITARIDRLPRLSGRHRLTVVIVGLIFMFDFIELNAFGFLAPTIQQAFALTVEQLGLLTSAAFVGMFIGAVVGGRLSDRFGRKTILLAGVVLFSVASFLTFLVPNLELFFVLRVLMGFGLQMVTGAVLVLVSETFPKATRARAMAVVSGIASLAGPLLAVVALVLVPLGHWRVVFLLGVLALIPGLIALRFLPESPRWLAVAGRGAAADAQVRVFERQVESRFGDLPPLAPITAVAPGSEKNSSFVDIFKKALIGRTIIASLAFAGLILFSFGFSGWAVYTLVGRGFPQTQALAFGLVLTFGAIAGSLLSTLWVDRVERKVNLIVVCLLLAVAFVVFGFVDNVPVLLIAGVFATILGQAATATMYAYVPEMYPVEVRGIGAGFANGVGRIAGIFSGIIIAAVIAAFTVQGVFVYLPLVTILMAIVIAFGPRIGVREARKQLLENRTKHAGEGAADGTSLGEGVAEGALAAESSGRTS